jgi:hypothetical protein
VIAAQAVDLVTGFPQINDSIDDAFAVRSPINEITEQEELIILRKIKPFQQSPERITVAVNVGDGVLRHKVGTGEFVLFGGIRLQRSHGEVVKIEILCV